jgi:hypothetical protein
MGDIRESIPCSIAEMQGEMLGGGFVECRANEDISPSIIITLPCRHPLASFFFFTCCPLNCLFDEVLLFFFHFPPLLSLKQRWVVLNFSSVRFSSVFVCRTESRVVVGSLSSQIFPEWRLCVHYYIYLSLSVISIRSSWLAGWLADCVLYA